MKAPERLKRKRRLVGTPDEGATDSVHFCGSTRRRARWFNRPMETPLLHLALGAPAGLVGELQRFYGERLGLESAASGEEGIAVDVGETTVEWRTAAGAPFYHVAFLVPGDRFAAALAWARERVELLPERESGEIVFDFAFWDALACYFHDPARSIVELIAHRGIGASETTGPFTARELIGVSEVGLVCDPPVAAAALEQELGLRVWDGTLEGERSLAFVGEQARTLILCRAGRPWLPTGRPAEPWPVQVVMAGEPQRGAHLDGGAVVRRAGRGATSAAAVRAS